MYEKRKEMLLSLFYGLSNDISVMEMAMPYRCWKIMQPLQLGHDLSIMELLEPRVQLIFWPMVSPIIGRLYFGFPEKGMNISLNCNSSKLSSDA